MVDAVNDEQVELEDFVGEEQSEGEQGNTEAVETEQVETEQVAEVDEPKKRLGKRERQQRREMREMQERLDMLQSQLAATKQPEGEANSNPDSYYGNEQSPQDIQKYVTEAVQATLRAKQEEEQRKVQQQQQDMMRKQYDGLHEHLDDVADSYEDFDEVVRSKDAPYTASMRDAALLLPRSGKGSAAEVFYKLGKNREELGRLAKLTAFEQVQEMLKLSRALEMGERVSKEASYKPIDSLKGSPNTEKRLSEDSSMDSFKERARKGWKG